MKKDFNLEIDILCEKLGNEVQSKLSDNYGYILILSDGTDTSVFSNVDTEGVVDNLHKLADEISSEGISFVDEEKDKIIN